MAATELATAYVQIMPTTKGIKSSLEKELTPAGEYAGQSAGSKIGSAIKKAIVAAGIGGAVKKALGEGMELQQNLGGTEAVFGEFAKNIQASASEAYKNMGMSASEYMATANKMGSLFQGSGIEQREALDLTTKAMQRAADVASVMGLDTSAAMESIAGAAKGNFTMMDNLGVAMNATTLQAYALEKGVNFKWDTASNAEKAELAMQMFFERTEQYAGNFERESAETLSGSLGAIKSALSDLLGNLTLGNDIAPSLEALKETISTFICWNLLPALVNILGAGLPVLVEMVISLCPILVDAGAEAIYSLCTGLGEAMPTLVPMAAQAITSIVTGLLDNIPALITAALALVAGLADGILAAIPVLIAAIPQIITSLVTAVLDSIPQIIEAGITLLISLVSALPQIISTIVTAVPAIVDGIVSALTGNIQIIVETGIRFFVALIRALPQIIATIVPAIPQIVGSIVNALANNIPQIIQAGIQLLTALISNLPSIISTIVAAMPQIIRGIVSALGQGVSQMVQVGGNLVKGLWQGIQSLASWLWSKVSGWISSIWDGICNFFGIHSPSTLFAWGGKMLPRGLAEGIKDETGVAVAATERMAEQVAGVNYTMGAVSLADGMDDITRQTAIAARPSLGVTPSAIPADAQGGIMAQLLAAVLALSDKLDNMAVYLDSDTLVGRILDKINTGLGRLQTLENRGGIG